jgi:hypothetical protein
MDEWWMLRQHARCTTLRRYATNADDPAAELLRTTVQFEVHANMETAI